MSVVWTGFAQKGDMLKHTKTHNRDRPATANKVNQERVVMEIEHISELALSDSEITRQFLIDMPIVKVETEITRKCKQKLMQKCHD
jgi:hypothetical protein